MLLSGAWDWSPVVSHVSETGESLGPSIQNRGEGVVPVHRPLEICRVAIF